MLKHTSNEAHLMEALVADRIVQFTVGPHNGHNVATSTGFEVAFRGRVSFMERLIRHMYIQ